MKSNKHSGDLSIAVMGYGWGHGAKGEAEGQGGGGFAGYWVEGDGATHTFLFGDGYGDTGTGDEGDGWLDGPMNGDGP